MMMKTLKFYKKRRAPFKSVYDWRWTLYASNGKVIGASTQGYSRRTDCYANADDVTRYAARNDITILEQEEAR